MFQRLIIIVSSLFVFTVSAQENENIEKIKITKKITWIENAIRHILIQKNNIENYDTISITLDKDSSIAVEESNDGVYIVYSKEYKDGNSTILIDEDSDGLADRKIVYTKEKSGTIEYIEYKINHSFEKIKVGKVK